MRNSPIWGRRWSQFISHGDVIGSKTIPIGAGGDGDGNPSPHPDPRKPAPNIIGLGATQIGPRRPSTGLSIYAKSNPNPSALLSPQPPAPHSATPAAARAPSADVANGSDVIHAIARALACVCTATPATLAESQPVSLSRLPLSCRMPCACSDDT